MKSTIKPFILFIALSFGCKTVVEMDIPREPPKLVINSTLVPGEYMRIHISQSQYILDENDFIPVSGASVDVYEDDKFLTTLPDSTNGNYISATYRTEKGKTYKIVASKDGFDEVSASVTIPEKSPDVLNIKLDTVEINEADYMATYLRFDIELKDDPDRENYYDISIIKKSWIYVYDLSVTPPVVIDSTLITFKLFLETKDLNMEDFQSSGEHLIFNDDLFNGKTYHLKVLSELTNEETEIQDHEGEPTYYVHIANTSKSHYMYEISFMLQKWSEFDPLAEPVLVFNNITNGYGILDACNIHTVVMK